MNARRKYIDLLKIVSAFCIVVLHVNSNSLHKVQNFLSENHLCTANAVHQLLYVAVPVFMILTGAGMFSKTMNGYKAIWPNVRKVLICIVLFGSVFELSRIVIRHESISALQFLCDVINGNSWSHMWFLSQLLGIYLIAPLLSSFFEKSKISDVWILAVLGFVFVILGPFLFGLAGIPYVSFFTVNISFFVYVLIGYLIEHTGDEFLLKYRFIFLCGLIVAAAGVILYTLYSGNSTMLEDNPITFICAVMLVFSAKAFVIGQTSEKMVKLSRCALGVYIIHPAMIHLLLEVIPNPHLTMPFVSVPILSLFIFAVSMVLVYLFRCLSNK